MVDLFGELGDEGVVVLDFVFEEAADAVHRLQPVEHHFLQAGRWGRGCCVGLFSGSGGAVEGERSDVGIIVFFRFFLDLVDVGIDDPFIAPASATAAAPITTVARVSTAATACASTSSGPRFAAAAATATATAACVTARVSRPALPRPTPPFRSPAP